MYSKNELIDWYNENIIKINLLIIKQCIKKDKNICRTTKYFNETTKDNIEADQIPYIGTYEIKQSMNNWNQK